MNLFISLILLLPVLRSPFTVVSDDGDIPGNNPIYQSHYTDQIPTLDGLLTDDAWSHRMVSGDWIDLLHCTDVKYRTSFKSIWDDTYLYFAISVVDPDIQASVTALNQRLHEVDNTIELFLDPGSDGLDYYEYQINAHGATWQLSLDKSYSMGGVPTDPAMIPGLKSAVHVDGTLNDDSDIDTMWTIEIAIPWSGLQIYMPSDPITSQVWRVNLSRVFQDSSGGQPAFWVWSCAEQFNMHLPATWGTLTFVKD